MSKSVNVRLDPPALGVAGIVARPVYYVSSRPEAYEVAGEVGHDQAQAIAWSLGTMDRPHPAVIACFGRGAAQTGRSRTVAAMTMSPVRSS